MNAFIQIQIDNYKYMSVIRTHGILVDMLLDITPDVYGPYVTTDIKWFKKLITQ